MAQIWVSISIGAQWSNLRTQREIIHPPGIGCINMRLRKSELIERLLRRTKEDTGDCAAARRSLRLVLSDNKYCG